MATANASARRVRTRVIAFRHFSSAARESNRNTISCSLLVHTTKPRERSPGKGGFRAPLLTEALTFAISNAARSEQRQNPSLSRPRPQICSRIFYTFIVLHIS